MNVNQKEKLMSVVKGLVGTVCIAVAAYCVMKYLNGKFHDNHPIDCQALKVYRNAIFFYLPQTAWIQYIENKCILVLMVFGGPIVIGLLGLVGVGFVIEGAKVYIQECKKETYMKKCAIYQEELEKYHYIYD